MSPRALACFAAAFASLLLAWMLTAAPWKTRLQPRLWPSASKRAVRLSFSEYGRSVVLKKTAEGWIMESPFRARANETALFSLLKSLETAVLSEPLGNSAARHELFAVGDGSGAVLSGWENGNRAEPLRWRVGIPGASAHSTFVRRDGSSEIREVRGIGRHEFSSDPSSWADLTIAAIDQTRILWIEADGKRFDPKDSRLEPLLLTLTRLSADAIEPLNAFLPEFKVEIKTLGPEGTPAPSIQLAISPLKSGRHCVQTTETPGICFSTSPWRLKSLFGLRKFSARP